MGLSENGSEKRFWSAKEAAAYVGIHPNTLYEYCKDKPVRKTHIAVPPFRRIGRGILRFPIVEFKEWCSRFDTPAQQERG